MSGRPGLTGRLASQNQTTTSQARDELFYEANLGRALIRDIGFQATSASEKNRGCRTCRQQGPSFGAPKLPIHFDTKTLQPANHQELKCA